MRCCVQKVEYHNTHPPIDNVNSSSKNNIISENYSQHAMVKNIKYGRRTMFMPYSTIIRLNAAFLVFAAIAGSVGCGGGGGSKLEITKETLYEGNIQIEWVMSQANWGVKGKADCGPSKPVSVTISFNPDGTCHMVHKKLMYGISFNTAGGPNGDAPCSYEYSDLFLQYKCAWESNGDVTFKNDKYKGKLTNESYERIFENTVNANFDPWGPNHPYTITYRYTEKATPIIK